MLKSAVEENTALSMSRQYSLQYTLLLHQSISQRIGEELESNQALMLWLI